MSRALKGPWITPKRDNFDGHPFYAAKTASDGKRRFIFGWNPTKKDSKDAGTWDWGGNLVVHEIRQEKNGELTVRVPETVSNAFKNPVKYEFNNRALEILNQKRGSNALKLQVHLAVPLQAKCQPPVK